MKILLFNSLAFHHELYGLFFTFCKRNKYNVSIYCPRENTGWIAAYKYLGFEFDIVAEFGFHDYDCVVLLTDSDLEFHNTYDSAGATNILVLQHWYIRRFFKQENHLQISPFHSFEYQEKFAMPIFEIATKFNKHKSYFTNRIYVVILGENELKEENLNFITNQDVVFQFINARAPKFIKPSRRVEVYVDLPALELFQMLANARYMFISNCYEEKRECYKTSSSIALAFSAGAQLIMPRAMNSFLRLKSPIIYDDDTILTLEHPNLDLVYRERDELMSLANAALLHFISPAQKIPRNVFQVCINPYYSSSLPAGVLDNIVALNPNYNYVLYDDAKLEQFIQRIPGVYDKYLEFGKNALACHKKDFASMFILYEYGGIYFDIDQEPLIPFREMIKDADFVVSLPVEKSSGMNTGFIAARKHSPIIKYIMENYMLICNFDDFPYDKMCKIAGQVLKYYLGVDNLQEGIYYVGGDKIIIAQETSLFGTYESCVVKYLEQPWFNSRYSDYPWNLTTKPDDYD